MTTNRLLPLVAAISFALASCKNEPSHQHATHEHSDTHDQAHVKQLTLNAGKKWNADDPTNAYVYNMQGIVERFDERVSNDFTTLADLLRVQTTDLVVNCKMTGPDHDALHLWLEPVLNDVKTLAGDDKAEAKTSYEHIKSSLAQYDTYFE